MKTIRIFIASSEELQLERDRLSDLIAHLNSIHKPQGIEIVPVRWEYLDASMGPLHKQQEYNRELKSCQLCLVLYWTRFGEYTASELDTAYAELCAGRNPQKLYIHFKDTEQISPELQTFKDSFSTRYGHFFSRFDNSDTLKLNVVLQFEHWINASQTRRLLEVRDSQILLGGRQLADLPNISFAGRNPDYLDLLERIGKAQARVRKYPDDTDLRQELCELVRRRNEMERSLLETAQSIAELAGSAASERLRHAVELFEAGDSRGANAVLDLAQIGSDADANARRIDAARAMEATARRALETNIEELRLKIRMLQNAMSDGWIEQAAAIYDEAIGRARGRIGTERFAALLLENADFLSDNNLYHRIGERYEEALACYRQLVLADPARYEADLATALCQSGVRRYKLKEFDRAEESYRQALEIIGRLAGGAPERFESERARTCFLLAALHEETGRVETAEAEYGQAAKIYLRLMRTNPARFGHDTASTLSNLATLYKNTGRFEAAEKRYEEALSLFRTLSERDTRVIPDIATTYNNLANLHHSLRKFDAARTEHEHALEIRRLLAEKNPAAYLPQVADSLDNLGCLYSDLRLFDRAERMYLEALEIRRRLAAENPVPFAQQAAKTLNNLAILYADTHRPEAAEKSYLEASQLLFRLTAGKSNPEAEALWATVSSNLAALYVTTGQEEAARQQFTVAWMIYRKLVEAYAIEQYKEQVHRIGRILREHFGMELPQTGY